MSNPIILDYFMRDFADYYFELGNAEQVTLKLE